MSRRTLNVFACNSLTDNQISASAVQLSSQNLPAKCEFLAEDQRTRPQNATSHPAQEGAFNQTFVQ
ncbi:hypothetical protein CAOG_009799 [Capsaspora owczarzaki ATCC 30864]|uniref:Uncharacterized protein n=1 Tax=Capsaspora owczarzaki (strain ATCC 30864) TaxID=595528 RepID=A0A0D2WQW6_CAPO3|nr:hypothetical protein CAOG_009799 [Capsaspora owczarzaki ATCC 30864]